MPNENIGGISVSMSVDLSGLASQLQQAEQMASDAGRAIAAALESANAAASGLDQLGNSLNNAAGGAQTFAGSLEGLGQQLSSLTGAGVALSALSAGIITLGEQALTTAGKFEQWQVSFTRLLGSAEAAKSMLDDLVNFAIRTPFEIPGLVENAQKLMAMGFSAQQVIPTLTTLGDAVSGLGKGTATLNSLTLAFGEMEAKGVVQLRQLNMLTTAGIPAIEMLAQAYGKSTQDMTDMISKKLIPAAQAIPVLLAGINEKFGGMMEAQSQTLIGMWSNLADAATKSFKAIGDTMLPVAKQLEDFGFQALTTVQNLAEAFGKLPMPVQDAAIAFAALAAAAGPVVLALGGLGLAITRIAAAAPVLVPIAGFVGGIAASLALFHITDLDSDFAHFFESVRDGFSGLMDLVKGATDAVGELAAAWDKLGPAARAAIEDVVPGLRDVFDVVTLLKNEVKSIDFKTFVLDALPPLQNLKDLLTLAATATEYLSGHYASMDAAAKAVNTSLASQTEALVTASGAYSKTSDETKALIDANARAYTQIELNDTLLQGHTRTVKGVSDAFANFANTLRSLATGDMDSFEVGLGNIIKSAEGFLQKAVDAQARTRDFGAALTAFATGDAAGFVSAMERMTAGTKGLTAAQQEAQNAQRILSQIQGDYFAQSVNGVSVLKPLSDAQRQAAQNLRDMQTAYAQGLATQQEVTAAEKALIDTTRQATTAHQGMTASVVNGVTVLKEHADAVTRTATATRDWTSSTHDVYGAVQTLSPALQKLNDIEAQAVANSTQALNAHSQFAASINDVGTAAGGSVDNTSRFAASINDLNGEAKAFVDVSSPFAASIDNIGTHAAGAASEIAKMTNDLSSADKNMMAWTEGAERAGNAAVSAMQVWSAAVAAAASPFLSGFVQDMSINALTGQWQGSLADQAAMVNTVNSAGFKAQQDFAAAADEAMQELEAAGLSWKQSDTALKGMIESANGSASALNTLVNNYLNGLTQKANEASKAVASLDTTTTAVTYSLYSSTTDLSNLATAVSDAGSQASDASESIASVASSLSSTTSAAAGVTEALGAMADSTQAVAASVAAVVAATAPGHATPPSSLSSLAAMVTATPPGAPIWNSPPGGSGPVGTPRYGGSGVSIVVTGNNITNQQAADQVVSEMTQQFRRVVGLKI